jgi:hypothetical protein
MAADEWPDPDPLPGPSLDDLDKRIGEVLAELTELKLEIEEQRWFRWGVTVALFFILWKLWR